MNTTLEDKFLSYFYCDNGFSTVLFYAYSLAIKKYEKGRLLNLLRANKLFTIDGIAKNLKLFKTNFAIPQEIEVVREIEKNLNTLKTEAEKEKYLFPILRVFGDTGNEFTYSAFVFSDKIIKDYFGVNRNIDVSISLSLCYFPEDEEKKILCYAIYSYVMSAQYFIYSLDGMLIKNGIDLLDLEEKSDFYILGKELTPELRLIQIESYFGSEKLAQYYYNALPNVKEPLQDESGLFVPKELVKYTEQIKTKRAEKYFLLAIENGLMKRSENGYHWNKSTALLAYFLQKVYCPNNVEMFPETAMNKLFNVTRLQKALTQLADNKTGKPKEHELIDRLFKN